ncbi:AMP-binding protein [Saccharothrix obliqua]|uniref:AMP-binding protein n=1 Tax=Saccharothrix obliqua TaxID=2861747 RepID=UPI001C6013EE|nr:AMP-binding protein [Saccharothrix obliqua]MBW4721897.1 AMP-binding protein [Saccharothrix obliqua]
MSSEPGAPALVQGDVLLTYGELAELAAAARAVVTGLGLPDGAAVCVPAAKSPAVIALVIGCLQAGRRVFLPSPDLGAEVLAELCERIGCAYLLEPGRPPRPTGAGPGPEWTGPGLLLATSGSTGLPKTVVLSESGVDGFLAWAADRFDIGPGTTVLNHAPLNFDLCLLDIWTTLHAGGRVVLVEQDKAANGTYLRDVCTRHPVDVVQAVPMFYRLLADANDAAGAAAFTGVKHVIFTGDAMPLNLLGRVPGLFPAARLWNVYGCTETNDTFLHEVDVAEAVARGALPIGRPIDGVTARIVDRSGAVVPHAGSGELEVDSPFRAHGYLDPELTARKWRDGFYRTGDLVTRDEHGLVFLAGRDDFHVKVRGVRTNLQEVEQVIQQHEDVAEAVVLAVPDEVAGHRLRAVVRRRPGSSLDSIRLRVHCAARLPKTAVPTAVEFVDRELPRTSTGKVDRRALNTTGERNRVVD